MTKTKAKITEFEAQQAVARFFRSISKVVTDCLILRELLEDHPDLRLRLTPEEIREMERVIKFLTAIVAAEAGH